MASIEIISVSDAGTKNIGTVNIYSKGLGTALKEGIPLAMLARIVNRLKKEHGGDKILRVTPASVAIIRTAKDRAGYRTECPRLTAREQKQQENAVAMEHRNLPGTDTQGEGE